MSERAAQNQTADIAIAAIRRLHRGLASGARRYRVFPRVAARLLMSIWIITRSSPVVERRLTDVSEDRLDREALNFRESRPKSLMERCPGKRSSPTRHTRQSGLALTGDRSSRKIYVSLN